MFQWFIRLNEFAKFSENPAPFMKNSIIPVSKYYLCIHYRELLPSSRLFSIEKGV